MTAVLPLLGAWRWTVRYERGIDLSVRGKDAKAPSNDI
jgi:hypothetical protein